jgi:hypothetical protein
MHHHLYRALGWMRRCLSARLAAAVCCLLVLLPTLNVRSIVIASRTSLEELNEESRPSSEDESEDLLLTSATGRRLRDECGGTASHCALMCGLPAGVSCGTASAGALLPAEHQLRNGFGAPLRC